MTNAIMVCPHCGQDIFSEHRTKEESIAALGANPAGLDISKAFVGALPEFMKRAQKAQAGVEAILDKVQVAPKMKEPTEKKPLSPAERAKAYRARKKGGK